MTESATPSILNNNGIYWLIKLISAKEGLTLGVAQTMSPGSGPCLSFDSALLPMTASSSSIDGNTVANSLRPINTQVRPAKEACVPLSLSSVSQYNWVTCLSLNQLLRTQGYNALIGKAQVIFPLLWLVAK